MKKIIIFISLFIGIFFNINAQSITANQLNGRLSIQTATLVADSAWSISGYFSHSTGKFTTNQIAVNDRFFIQIGANTYVGRISVVNSVAVNLITFRVICNYPNPPNGVGAIIRPTSNGYPVYVDGIANNLQAGIQNYFATLVNTNAAGNFCEQTLTKTAHGFRKWTPIYWNGSTWVRPTNDTIIPTYIVIDSTSANTFKVANCGNYSTTLSTGMYWFTGTSPGYTTTAPTVKTPLFEVAQGRLILQPLTGFNLTSTNANTNTLSTQKDTFYVLGIGQSNMIGRPDTSVTKGAVVWDSTKNNSVLVFNLEINQWQTADKLNCHGTWGNLYGGVSVNNAVWQFCKELQRRTKAVVKYVISARGGRALSYWTGGTYPMTGEGEDSITAHVARSGVNKFDVVIWDQGESDIANSSYETQFRNFFLKDIRNRSWFDSYKPVIITGMPVTNANYIPFNERLIKLTDLSDPYLNIAQTDSLALVTNDPFSPGDNVHFTGISLQRLGARYFNAFINTPKAAKSGLFDLAWRDVLVNAKGNTLRLDSLDGVIDVAADKRFYVQKTEPGWAGRFEPYQYIEHTANGDPRVEFQSFVGNDLDAPGNITQNSGYPRLGSFHFRGWLNGAYRRGASIAVYPDSVWSNAISGMMRFTTVAGGNGFNISETIMSMSQRGHAMGPGIVKPDSDAAWQVDQSNRSTYYFNGASRTYSKFKNTIFGIQDASVYSLVHNPFVDTTLIRGSARFVGPNTTVRIGKSEYADNGNIETGLDIISKYTSSWDSRLVMNPYGYLDLYSTESSGGGNPRFYFYSSRGNSQTTKLRNQPNDYVGFIDFAAYNGSSYHTGAVIGTTINANSAAGSSRFSQMMFFGIDKSGTQPHISSNWVMALDTNRCYVPKNFQAGGLLNGTTADLFVNSVATGKVGVGTVTPTSRLHVAGSFSNMVTTISSATTLGEHTVVFATGASTYLVTLPSAGTCVGRRYMIKVNGGAKTISSYLDLTGSASTTLANNSVLNLISDGTNWQQL